VQLITAQRDVPVCILKVQLIIAQRDVPVCILIVQLIIAQCDVPVCILTVQLIIAQRDVPVCILTVQLIIAQRDVPVCILTVQLIIALCVWAPINADTRPKFVKFETRYEHFDLYQLAKGVRRAAEDTSSGYIRKNNRQQSWQE
jgi:hypothetical protein